MFRCGTKRLLPGRLLRRDDGMVSGGLEILDTGSNEPKRLLVSDMNSAGGTAGGPLIEFHSGKVIALHVAGYWKDVDEGKFAYAQPLVWTLNNAGLNAELYDAIKSSQAALK